MNGAVFRILAACKPSAELAALKKRFRQAADISSSISTVQTLAALREELRRGRYEMLLLSESFSRKPLESLLLEFATGRSNLLLILEHDNLERRALAARHGVATLHTSDLTKPECPALLLAHHQRFRETEVSREDQASYRRIVGSLDDGVGIIGPDGLIRYVNASIARIAGSPASEWIGVPLKALLPGVSWAGLRRRFKRAEAGGVTHQLTLTSPERRFEISFSPRFTARGQLQEVVFVARDITTVSRASSLTALQLDLSRQLAAADNAAGALSAAVHTAMTVVQCSSGAVFYRNDSPGFHLVERVALPAAPEVVPESDELQNMLTEGGILRAVDKPTCPDALKPLCLPDAVMVPVKGAGEASAFIVLSGIPLHEVQEDQFGALGALASMLASSLERIRADERHRRTNQYLQGVVDSQEDMVVRIDTNGYYTFANDAYCNKFGQRREALIGQRFVPEVHPEDYSSTLRALVRVRKPPYRVSVEHRVRIDGEWRWFAWENSSILNDAGAVIEIQGVCRDVTSQRLVHHALEASEAKLRAILNNTLQAFVLFDADTNILALNRVAQWDRDLTVGELMQEGRSIIDYALPDELPRFQDGIRRVLNGETVKYESHTVFRTGELRWFEIQLIPVHDKYGDVVGGLLTTIDINDRKLAQQAVERSEQRFRSLVQNSSDMITIFSEDAKLLFQTSAVERILGYAVEDLLGKSIFDLIHPEDLDDFVNRFQETQRTRDANIPIEFRIRRKDGHWVFLETIASNRIEDPDIHGVVLTSRDITERRRSEEQLRLLATAIGTAEEAVVITDAELDLPGPRILFVNEGFSRISGYAPREVLGKTPRILQGEKTDRKLLAQMKRDIAVGKSFSGENINYRKDGSAYSVEWRISPVYDVSGRITHYVSIQRDITSRKRAEEKLQNTAEELARRNTQLETARKEAEKARAAVEQAAAELRQAYDDAASARKTAEEANEAKSQFLASMSHEIRTPLTAIIGFARLMAEHTEDEESRGFISQILSASEHLLSLINDILDLSRIEAGRLSIAPEPVDLSRLVAEVVEMYRPRAEEKGMKLRLTLGKLPPAVSIDISRFRQVLTNLIANAIKFSLDGEIVVRVDPLKKEEGVRVEVEDSGPGIPPEQKERIFEPFYQAQDANLTLHEGAGLGLTITARIIQAMKGRIDVVSELGKGSCFIVEAPCEFLRKPLRVPVDIQPAPHGEPVQGLKILVADDHAPNRTLIRHILTTRGHEVVLATNGLEALDAFEREIFDVVVLDVQMPHMDGYQAIRHIRASPGGDRIPILTLTAYAMRGDRERSIAAGADDYFPKPFDPGKLAQRIEQLGRGTQNKAVISESDLEIEELRVEYLEGLADTLRHLKESEPNAEELRLHGHRIAGSGGTFGFAELSRLGRLLDQEARKTDGIDAEEVSRLLDLMLEEVEKDRSV